MKKFYKHYSFLWISIGLTIAADLYFLDAKGDEVWRPIGEIYPQKVRDSVK